MKFAIPLAEGKLTDHFGHCQQFAIADVQDNQVVDIELLTPPPHEPGVLPRWLHEQGANVVIAGGMGQRAIMLFNQVGIEVVTGAPVADPEELVTLYLQNNLVTKSNACSGGGHGDGTHSCGGNGHQ